MLVSAGTRQVHTIDIRNFFACYTVDATNLFMSSPFQKFLYFRLYVHSRCASQSGLAKIARKKRVLSRHVYLNTQTVSFVGNNIYAYSTYSNALLGCYIGTNGHKNIVRGFGQGF